MKKSGFAIILVLATLVLLALLSLTYIKLALIDRNIARNYMDNKRAKLIAQSGVDYAIARIQEDIFDTSWQEAKTITINGKVETYTENAGSTYGQDRDIFKVEVRDCNSMINVNDGLGNAKVTADTKRILNVLGDVKGITNLGDKIIDKRPVQGYASKQELLKAISAAELDVIKDLVTTHAWQDPNVANPVPLTSRYGKGKDASGALLSGDLKYAPELVADPAGYDHAIYGLDELNPQWIEIVSRSPVNINQADEKVLISLIKDLKGFFCSDRRRDTPTLNTAYTMWNYSSDISGYFNYAPGETIGDELGFLYSTEAISNAQEIANEIKKCRENDPDYSSNWFRGPFKTWRQFNTFVDDLISRGLIQDSRSGIYQDYCDAATTIAYKIAHQAKGDVLKANFNPNLHLNELNPDANIKTLVDKTDLIVNSTEFCFTPMGHFQIESEGFILKPSDADNIVIANSRIEVAAKLYDCYSETNQRQFLQGQIPNTASDTNNGKTLEIGPEPSHVLESAAKENEYSGYIALPTYKGLDTLANIGMYSHYTDDFTLKSHASGQTANLTGHNAADPTEPTKRGPYIYGDTTADGVSKHTLCKSYRSNAGSKYAAADLRIDGAYLERHSGLAYSIDSNVLKDTGVACYWVKPWFYPEQAGKPRCYLNICDKSNSLATAETSGNPLIFANYYFPSQGGPEVVASPVYGSSFRKNSLAFCFSDKIKVTFKIPDDEGGFTFIHTTTIGAAYGLSTPCLNHNYHTDGKATYLKSGQWVHITCRWDLKPAADLNIYVNGNCIADTSRMPNHENGVDFVSASNILGETQILHIGPAGLISQLADPKRNWSADSTVDEFYFFTIGDQPTLDSALDMYRNSSRYLRPQPNQSYFISQSVDLSQQHKLAPSNTGVSSPDGSTGPGATLSSNNKIKVIGLSWTWYAEDTDSTGKAIMKNYKDYPLAANNDPLTFIYTQVKAQLIKNRGMADEYKTSDFTDDAYSPVDLDISGTDTIEYKVIFELPNTPLDTVLLYTAVFDDITIYYTNGTKFLQYSVE